jgi:RNA polymerase-associated protein RTF1
MQLPEIEREKILGERMEEHQRILDKRNLNQMLKDQAQGGDSESVSKAAKRRFLFGSCHISQFMYTFTS